MLNGTNGKCLETPPKFTTTPTTIATTTISTQNVWNPAEINNEKNYYCNHTNTNTNINDDPRHGPEAVRGSRW